MLWDGNSALEACVAGFEDVFVDMERLFNIACHFVHGKASYEE